MRPFEKQQSLGGKTMLNVNRIFLNMLLFVFLAVSNNAYAVLFLASGEPWRSFGTRRWNLLGSLPQAIRKRISNMKKS